MSWTEENNAQYVKTHMQIVTECLKYIDETGYLIVQIDDCFCLVEDSIQFIKGDFDKDKFPLYDASINIPPGMTVKDCFFVYFSVIGANNVSRLSMRKMILTVDKI